MSKETLVFILGIVAFFTPFIGVPSEYKKWILIVIGGLLMSIGYVLRREAFLQSFTHESGERRANVFVESPQVPEGERLREKDTLEMI